MERIYIRDLALRCIIGAFPHERKDKQDVVINIAMDCDFGRAAETDQLDDTVNYKEINKKIIRMVEASSFNLIESMAEGVAGLCLENLRVARVTVTVDKPGALRFARSVAVEVTRTRNDGS
jgi:dihydroneopterin aldolase/D-erythro-7,8-dihydroneopterin triphosphate epimerase